MQLNSRALKSNIIFLFCTLYFILLPASFTKYAYLILFISFYPSFKTLRFSLKTFALITFVFLITFTMCTSFPHRHFLSLFTWFCLIFIYFFMQKLHDCSYNINDRNIELLLWIFTIIVVFVQLFFGQKASSGDSLLYAAYSDRNYTGIIIFLLFSYGEKRKLPGRKALLAATLLFFSNSRSLLLLTLTYIIIKYSKHFLPDIKGKKSCYIFSIFILSGAAMIIFSYVWVYVISNFHGNAILNRLNDDSNKMRFSSNIYTWQYLMCKKEIIFSGFGNDLKSIMGIPNNEPIIFNGVRLVRTHNSILSIIVTMGWLPGLSFIYILSKTIAKYCSKSNYEYIIPFFLNAMLIPEFEQGFLIFWFLILVIPVVNSPTTLKLHKAHPKLLYHKYQTRNRHILRT